MIIHIIKLSLEIILFHIYLKMKIKNLISLLEKCSLNLDQIHRKLQQTKHFIKIKKYLEEKLIKFKMFQLLIKLL